MTSQDLVRNKRHVEVLAARAELLVQIAGDNQRLRSELNITGESLQCVRFNR